MVLMTKLTAMGLLLEVPPLTTMLAERVPAEIPAGSAETESVAGVVPVAPNSCPFTLSQGVLGYESAKGIAAPVLLVIVMLWEGAAAPPT